jgi:hypothetical protein
LWNTFAKQNHKKATYKLSSHEVAMLLRLVINNALLCVRRKLPERFMHPTKKRTDLMELHPSRINFKKPTNFINPALNLARPANREKLKTRDHRSEQRQINTLKLRFHKPLKSTRTKVILTFITLSTAAVCKLGFCGNLLRSKTTKTRLTNCPATKWRCCYDLL